MYLNVLGQPMVVIGSYKIARELLDKRSGNYSDRPRSVMAGLYVKQSPVHTLALKAFRLPRRTGLDCMTVLRSYGPEWRKHRRAFGKSFSADTVAVYEPMHHEFARKFLSELLLSPKSLCQKINL